MKLARDRARLALCACGLILAGCTATPPPVAAADPPELGFVDAGLGGLGSDAALQPDAPATEKPICGDELGEVLARESCDGDRILVAHNVAFHPSRPAPAEPERGVLAEVASVMRSHPKILLLRIEVYSSEDPRRADERRSELEQAQLRADGLFSWLWRHEKLDAERLEAIGYVYDARVSRADPSRWPVVLRIVQRAR